MKLKLLIICIIIITKYYQKTSKLLKQISEKLSQIELRESEH